MKLTPANLFQLVRSCCQSKFVQAHEFALFGLRSAILCRLANDSPSTHRYDDMVRVLQVAFK